MVAIELVVISAAVLWSVFGIGRVCFGIAWRLVTIGVLGVSLRRISGVWRGDVLRVGVWISLRRR